MNPSLSNRVGCTAGILLLALAAAAQQPDDTWSLQAPFLTTNGILGNDPLTGALLRVGGSNNSLGALQHAWVWLDGRWERRTGETPNDLYATVASATDTLRGQLVVVGGTAANGTQTWTYDGRRWQNPATHPLLTLRSGHAMTFDSARGRVVLFGGRAGAGNSVLADTWEWDGSQWLLRQPGAAPPARYEHRLAFDAARGRTVLFGGRTGAAGTQLGDTWEWDGTYWLPRITPTAPVPRYQHGMVYDAQRQRVVVAGGSGNILLQAVDTWEWDGATWTQTVASGTPTAGLLQPTELVYDARLGKTLLPIVGKEELHEYTGTAWIRTATAPMPRYGGTLTFDPVRNETLLFGGTTGSAGPFGDTWRWRDGRWQLTPASTSPSARSLQSTVFDAARGEIVLFGGYFYATSQPQLYLGDTWSWNGATWTQRPTTGGPSARGGSVLGYHAPTQRVVLFGGGDTTTEYGDTWLWDGSTWAQATPPQSPSPRTYGCATSRPNDVVLFGGATRVNSLWTYLDDTWSWNGTTWAQIPTSQAPSARSYAAMAYDADHDRILLVGGNPHPTQVVADDTWVFDGTDWSILTNAETPLVRSGAALAYDTAERRMLLFGGTRFSVQNDLWALDAAAQTTTFGSGCPGTLGTPTLAPATNGSPTLGSIVAADVGSLPLSLALVTMGFSTTTTGTTPLPLALGSYGMPSCSLLVAPDAVLLAIGSQNAATWRLTIPFVTALAGLEFSLQAFALDPAANAAGATTSNGVSYRVGG
ncbi:MAG: hypothetical protein RL398_25 [Planctomycetota bacterium]